MLPSPATAQTHEVPPAQVVSTSRVVNAVEHIRPMRGGSQPHLMRCSDGHYYVVKFRNNPQGSRILVNEYIAGRLAKLLGLPCPDTCLVNVREELVQLTPGLTMELRSGKVPVEPGLTFGSQYPSYPDGPGRRSLHLVGSHFAGIANQVENLSDFLGILMFDKWTCNTDHREVIFLPRRATVGTRYRIMMVDNGFCFNGINWNFPNSPILGLYHDWTVYRNVDDVRSSEDWLCQLEVKITGEELMKMAEGIPKLWLAGGTAALTGLLVCLFKRKRIVPELIRQAIARTRGCSSQSYFHCMNCARAVSMGQKD